MSELPPVDESWGWTRPQRFALGMLLTILLGILFVQYLRRPARLEDRQVVYEGEALTLPRRVDPNTATAAELTRIPLLAEGLAGRIIEYRNRRLGLATNAIVFRQPEDLAHVPGLGKKTLERLRPYLQFPDDEETPIQESK